MRRYRFASCIALVLVTVLAAVADDGKSSDAKKSFRFVLQPNESQDRLLALPASENEKPPKNGTLVICDSLRFERNAIVFVNASLESEGERITATEVTVQLDKMSDLDVSWKLSDDFKMTFKTAEAKQRFVNEQTR